MSDVVSLTPAALARDSRTLKQAITFARLGHRSTVVEAQSSGDAFAGAPFALRTLRSVGAALDAQPRAPSAGPSAIERAAAVLGRLAGPAYFLASWTAFNLATWRRLPRADAYWVHGYEQALAVWLAGAPYVYDAHDVYSALPYDGRALSWSQRATHRVRARIERACARHAAACVTTSAAMARACERRLGRPFAVVHNAQDARLARPCARDVRTAAGASDRDFVLAMVAQRKPGTVVPAALPGGVRLAIVGDGYDGEPARPGVAFTGSVAPEEVAAFIASADAAALLYVPVTANSPTQLVNGLFHAVAAGLPLLYPTGMDAIRELAEEHDLGVAVDPADPASLAAGLAALRADLDRYRANVAAAAPRLDWAAEEPAVAALLDRALAAGRAR